MGKSIFWSWQSDHDARVTRNLIREAMTLALDRLNAEVEIEDRFEIDHDTKGIPGSPDIVSSILEKIDASSIFVADITPIVISPKGKHLANSNVLIELGYAKKSLGLSKLITVWNTAFTNCTVADLPFDLRGKRGPIAYNLAASADKAQLREARNSLVASFESAIKACLTAQGKVHIQEPNWKPSAAQDTSTWVSAGEEIVVNEGFGSGTKTLVVGPRWYVRILPSTFDPKFIDDGAFALPPDNGSYSSGRTSGGTLTYSGSVRAQLVDNELLGATMWFRDTGEIWSNYLDQRWEQQGILYGSGLYVAEKWAENIWFNLPKLQLSGGKGPFKVKIGVNKLAGTHWHFLNSFGGPPPRALQNDFEYEFIINSIEIESWKEKFILGWTAYHRVYGLMAPDEAQIDNIFRHFQ